MVIIAVNIIMKRNVVFLIICSYHHQHYTQSYIDKQTNKQINKNILSHTDNTLLTQIIHKMDDVLLIYRSIHHTTLLTSL